MKCFRRVMAGAAMLLAACLLTGCGESKKTEPAEPVYETGTINVMTGEEVDFTSGDSRPADQSEDAAPEAADDGTGQPESGAAGESEGAEEPAEGVKLDISEALTGLHHARITIRNYGKIDLELDADQAPLTVTNFVMLSQNGFYDGLTFHRIIEGFMMQGGDPKGNGTGGSDVNIPGEFSSNGIDNTISHERGVISMARSSAPDSASSQFFIVQKDSTFLDGQYAAFGHVTDGMEVVDMICQDASPVDSNGTIPAVDQPVIDKIIILD